MHVALGAMQDENPAFVTVMLIVGFGTVAVLHVWAGWRERATDRGIAGDGWLPVRPPRSIPDKGARIVAGRGGERIAVFRDGDQIAAFTNLCAHQGGPIGEGCVIDGLVTCPWHGFQYRPRTVARHRLSPKSSRPIGCGSTAAQSRWTRGGRRRALRL